MISEQIKVQRETNIISLYKVFCFTGKKLDELLKFEWSNEGFFFEGTSLKHNYQNDIIV